MTNTRSTLRDAKRFDEVEDGEGERWTIITAHPSKGRRAASLTLLSRSDGWAFLDDVDSLEQQGFKLIEHEEESR